MRSYFYLAGAALLILGVGCANEQANSGGGAGSGGTGRGVGGTGGVGGAGGTGGSLSADLACVQEGYPCSMADTPAAVLDDAIAVLLDALEVRANGTMDDALAFLEEHPSVIEAFGDGRALRFRIEGSCPVWLTDRTGIASGERSLNIKSLHDTSAVRPKAVVGEDTSSDQKVDNRDDKRALLLAPYFWEFAPNEESELLAERLEQLPGYEGNISFKSNRTEADQEIGIGDYIGWTQYDLIYVSTHGSRMCVGPSGTCVVMVSSGVRWDLGDRPQISTAGVYPLGQYDADLGYSTDHVELGLSLDFFQGFYGKGLDHAMVVFSVCETGDAGASELAQAIGGEDFVMFGWTETVDTPDAFSATGLLFEKLEQGLPAASALDEVDDAGLRTVLNSDFIPTELVRFAPNGGDQRLYEIPRLRDGEGPVLVDGHDITEMVEGMVGDGQADRIELTLEIDGVEADNKDDFRIRYRLDDRDLQGNYDLANATQVGAFEYNYRAIHDVDVGFDLESGTDVPLEVIVDLPEGDESRFTVDVTLSPCRWTMSFAGPDNSGNYEGTNVALAPAGQRGSFFLLGGPTIVVQLHQPVPVGVLGSYVLGIVNPAEDDGGLEIQFGGEDVYRTGNGGPLGAPGSNVGNMSSPATLQITVNDAERFGGIVTGNVFAEPATANGTVRLASIQIEFFTSATGLFDVCPGVPVFPLTTP